MSLKDLLIRLYSSKRTVTTTSPHCFELQGVRMRYLDDDYWREIIWYTVFNNRLGLPTTHVKFVSPHGAEAVLVGMDLRDHEVVSIVKGGLDRPIEILINRR